jgi:hypothetical protein
VGFVVHEAACREEGCRYGGVVRVAGSEEGRFGVGVDGPGEI